MRFRIVTGTVGFSRSTSVLPVITPLMLLELSDSTSHLQVDVPGPWLVQGFLSVGVDHLFHPKQYDNMVGMTVQSLVSAVAPTLHQSTDCCPWDWPRHPQGAKKSRPRMHWLWMSATHICCITSVLPIFTSRSHCPWMGTPQSQYGGMNLLAARSLLSAQEIWMNNRLSLQR